jgi:tetratricopeptide (TPR) repeat protein
MKFTDMVQRVAVFACVPLCFTPALAQICDNRAGAPMQMQVQLTFAEPISPESAVPPQDDSMHRGDGDGSHSNFDLSLQISVQLQDPLGGTLQETRPSSDGQVRLTVCRKTVYRLRVIGPTIQEAIVDDVQPGRGDRIVSISLHRKRSQERQKGQKAIVSAHSLKIPGKAQKEFEKGDDALKNARLQEAEQHYRRAVALYPQFEDAENNLGIVLMQQGRKTEGQAAFEHALSLNPAYAPAQVNLAKIAFDEKRYEDSYTLARQALRSDPLSPSALFVAAESAFFKSQYSETVSLAQTLHSLPHQQYALVHYLAGKSLEAQQQPAAAVVEYRMFVEEDPRDPNVARAQELIVVLQAMTVEGVKVSK